MQWIRWGRLEFELLVESSGFLVLGVDQDCSCANLAGRRECSSERVFQKRSPESFPLLSQVYGEAGKPPCDSLRSTFRLYARCCERVVPEAPSSSMNDKDPG